MAEANWAVNRTSKLLVAAFVGAFLCWLLPSNDASARNVYVANNGSANVSVIDTATNTVTSTITTAALPGPPVITPDGANSYLGSSATNILYVNSLPTFASVTSISFSSGLFGAIVNASGDRAYAFQSTGSVSPIDTSTNTVLTTISAGGSPRNLGISPDGSRVYVCDNTGDSVKVIDTATNTVTETISVGDQPQGIGIMPNGARAYIANNGSGTVSVIDLSTNTVTATITAGTNTRNVAITPDGSRAYVGNNGSGNVSVIDTATNTVVATVTTGTGPGGLAVTPDGTRVYATNGTAGTVSVINTSTNAVESTITVGTTPRGAAIAPDQGPVASFVATAGAPGSATSFDASGSSDDGSIATYSWNFGDGTTATTTSAQTTHTYASAGSYTATLTVTDNLGTSTTDVFNGQAVLRNGTPAATTSKTVQVAAPTTTTTTTSDTTAPTVTITDPKNSTTIKNNLFRKISGTASDAAGIEKVQYSLHHKKTVKDKKGKKKTFCRYITSKGELGSYHSCTKIRYQTATGTDSWSAKIKNNMPRGLYVIRARATDKNGNVSQPQRAYLRLTSSRG